MDNSIVISTPPHVKSKRTTRGIMLDVCIALLPCVIAGIVYFGLPALMIELVAVAACVATEFVYYFLANKGFSNKCKDAGKVCVRWWKQFDFTSVVTGLILALIVPATTKWYEILIGGVFSIAIVKMLFGGTGKNLVNPASTGRVFMAISFAAVSTYTAANFGSLSIQTPVFSGATNLAWLFPSEGNPTTALPVLDLFLGTGVAGCIGETCKLAIIVGYVYLCVRKVIKWWQPLLFVVVFGFAAAFMSGFLFIATGGYIFDMKLFLPHIFSGGVLFGAVFMFTDYVTSPKGVYGQIVYYVVAALLVAVLRYLTHMEVTSFVIMLMNLFVPLIDKYIIRKPFGYKKVKKEKKTPDEKVAEAVDALKVDENAAAKVQHGDSTENTDKSPAASVQSVGTGDVKSDKEEA